jgi:hypothetical protein
MRVLGKDETRLVNFHANLRTPQPVNPFTFSLLLNSQGYRRPGKSIPIEPQNWFGVSVSLALFVEKV